MTIDTDVFDGIEVVRDCTVFTMLDSVHYEAWYPWTRHLIVADPKFTNAEHMHCDVLILRNSENGNVSYGWKEI